MIAEMMTLVTRGTRFGSVIIIVTACLLSGTHVVGAQDVAAQPEAADAPDDAAQPTATSAHNGETQTANLKVRLQQVQTERAGMTSLWPWLVVGAGTGSTLFATAIGAGYALTCHGECATHSWVAAVVVGGIAVATLGTIWLVRNDRDIAEVESKKYQIERDLERVDRASLRRDRAQAQAVPVWSLHF